MSTKSIGDFAESLACQFLQNKGLRLLQRNYRCKRGEIDLIMQQNSDSLVFIEVRYRKHAGFGRGFETVTRNKQRRIAYCAQQYLARYGLLTQPARFDVISIEGPADKPELEWLTNAFHAEF